MSDLNLLDIYNDYRDRALMFGMEVPEIFEVDGYTYKAILNNNQVVIYLVNWPIDIDELVVNDSVYGISGNHDKNDKLRKVVLGKNLKRIEESSFCNFIALEDINLENIEYIGTKAFKNTFKLKHLNLGKNLYYLGNRAFECSGVEELKFNSELRSLCSSSFSYCMNLKRVENLSCHKDVSNYNLKENQGVHRAIFKCCENLEEVNILGLDSITSEMFANCNKLNKVLISEEFMLIEKDAFYHCESLSDIYANNIKIISGMNYCGDVSLHVNNCNAENLISTNLKICVN